MSNEEREGKGLALEERVTQGWRQKGREEDGREEESKELEEGKKDEGRKGKVETDEK